MNDERFPWATWRTIAKAQTALCAAGGAVAMATPGLLIRALGGAPSATGTLFARAFGAGLLHVAWAHNGLRATNEPGAVRAIARANLMEDALLTILAARAIKRGTFGAPAWLLVGAFAGEVALNAWLLRRFEEPGAETVSAGP